MFIAEIAENTCQACVLGKYSETKGASTTNTCVNCVSGSQIPCRAVVALIVFNVDQGGKKKCLIGRISTVTNNSNAHCVQHDIIQKLKTPFALHVNPKPFVSTVHDTNVAIRTISRAQVVLEKHDKVIVCAAQVTIFRPIFPDVNIAV